MVVGRTGVGGSSGEVNLSGSASEDKRLGGINGDEVMAMETS
jgi:hypothetical protein